MQNLNAEWRVWKEDNAFRLIFSVPDFADKVDLPYDAVFHTQQRKDSVNQGRTGFLDGGVFHYYKELEFTEQDYGKHLTLIFDGVGGSSSVYVNGCLAGENKYAYSEFMVDITPWIKPEGKNQILVTVNAMDESSRYYCGGGIDRDVWLISQERVRILPESLRCTTERINNHQATVLIEAELQNDLLQMKECLATCYVRKEGRLIHENRKPVTLPPNQPYHYTSRLLLEDILPWDEDHPELYEIQLSLNGTNQQPFDTVEILTGFRRLALDSKNGMLVNGIPVKLRGACVHHDQGLLGGETYDAMELRRIRILKEAGFNAVRCAHNPASKSLLQACDRLGMYVMDEAFDMWAKMKNPHDYALFFSRDWEQALKAMVRVDYNHPCVILYSTGNEITEIGTLTLRLSEPYQAATVAYGESEAEALDLEWCYYQEKEALTGKLLRKRAFRYAFVPGMRPENVDCEAIHQEFPIAARACFQSSDSLINSIWHTAKETFHLCSGLFFIDGIKRDRWIWSGDAYQSYFVNQYLFFDEEINKRTIRALRGNTQITQHLNTIVDYSLLWLISIENHYWMTGDKSFLSEVYPKMEAMMSLLDAQTDERGFLYGRPQDWIYIDWAEMDKGGVLCAEQILLWRSCLTMAFCQKTLGQSSAGYEEKADRLRAAIQHYFWDEEKGAFIDTFESGKRNVTRHANIFAILFDFVESNQAEKMMQNVLLNPVVPAITTPYFKFFELDMWGKIGRLDLVWDNIRKYWGGMLEEGAVTFWEQYDPLEKGNEHYAMYGDPFGKSLCHAWAASPIYLLGRYFLGVYPSTPGYRSFVVEPHLEYFDSVSCDVPIKDGLVRIEYKDSQYHVRASRPGGKLRIHGELIDLSCGGDIH